MVGKAGIEPAVFTAWVADLQSAAIAAMLTCPYRVSAERLELPFPESKTGVLPLDETEIYWCLRQESNSRQPVLQTSALPTELQRHISFLKQQTFPAGFRSMEAGTARCLRQESNLRQPVLQTSALPTELQRHGRS